MYITYFQNIDDFFTDRKHNLRTVYNLINHIMENLKVFLRENRKNVLKLQYLEILVSFLYLIYKL